MTDSKQQRDSGSVSAPIDSDAVDQDRGSSLIPKRVPYQVPNRLGIQALKIQPISHTQVSSPIVTKDYGEEGRYHGAAASETAPGRFQETRIVSLGEVRQRAYQALERAEQRHRQLREEEARLSPGEDE